MVFQAAAAIFISEGEKRKYQKEEKTQTEISLCKETADGRRVEKGEKKKAEYDGWRETEGAANECVKLIWGYWREGAEWL